MSNKPRAAFIVNLVPRTLPSLRNREVENILNVFEAEIRKDQKKKCAAEIESRQAKTDWHLEPEEIAEAVMGADG